MSETKPAPLTTTECDLRGMEWMPLYGHRLFMSDFEARASDAEFRAAMRLWWTAWQQVPAASLPDDDAVLCRLAGLTKRQWLRMRIAFFAEWIACNDGRLYHPDLAAFANEASARTRRIAAKINRRLEIASGAWAIMRRLIFERDQFTCGYCGQVGGRLECDHILPAARGGKTEPSNLITACFSCNRSKGARTGIYVGVRHGG